MKEKTHEVSIKVLAPQASFTRAANRFIKDYKEVYGSCVPTDIEEAWGKIKEGLKVEHTDHEHKDTLFGNRDYDRVEIISEFYYSAGYEIDEYGEDFYEAQWYFFENWIYYKEYFGHKFIGSLENIHRETFKAKGEIRYYCTHCPPDRGCIPEGFITYDTYRPDERYCGEVTYNEAPSDYELDKWGLILDKEYPLERAARII